MNEDMGGMQLKHAVERLPGHYAWKFFDGAWPEHTPALLEVTLPPLSHTALRLCAGYKQEFAAHFAHLRS